MKKFTMMFKSLVCNNGWITVILLTFCLHSHAQYTTLSPNGHVALIVDVSKGVSFSVKLAGQTLIEKADINLDLSGQTQFTGKLKANLSRLISEVIEAPISFKHKKIDNKYHLFELESPSKQKIQFRVYNDGVAYRYVTNINKEVTVNEQCNINFHNDPGIYASLIEGYSAGYEEIYTLLPISQFPQGKNTYTPVLLADASGKKVFISESDVQDYPHLFFKKGNQNQLIGTLPPYPLKTINDGDRGSKVIETANYVAKTSGARNFPWRVFITTQNDGQLIESDMIYKLAPIRKTNDFAWVKPGRVAWDWWNDLNLYGVDFKTGLNTQTWKAYADFAAENGLEYIILDEGWSASLDDISKTNPDLDMVELVNYAKSKNVKLILWASWRALEHNWSAFDTFKKWGVAGVKVDFMDRADQWMVNFYERVAKAAFDSGLVVDFHGAYKPTGLQNLYPNILSHEGVMGLEWNKFSTKYKTENTALIPFIRMVNGPVDFTPGAMRNLHEEEFYQNNFKRPASKGTRCQQVALYIILESGIQMFADSPSNYRKEFETLDFIKQVPVLWDDTKVLDAAAGKYAVVARRNGNRWFVGGITGNEAHTSMVDFSFLGEGKYTATIMQDGINVEKMAEDYKKYEMEVTKQSKLSFNMYKGGGFAIMLEKK